MKLLVGFVVAFTAFSQSAPTFEVASIKPNATVSQNAGLSPLPGGRMTAENVRLRSLIRFAYRVRTFQVTGGPAWIDKDRWDINARGEAGATREQVPDMLKALLTDRFKLILHRETKESSVYFLVPAKGGMQLPESKEGSCVTPGSGQPGPDFCGNISIGLNALNGWRIEIKQFIEFLSDFTGRMVIDKTGFTGTFDAHLEFVRDPTSDSNLPSIFTALQEQLGLKLDSGKAPVEILVIDHAEKASEN